MAKKAKGGPNKSSEIRGYKDANPTASPKEIAEALGKQGIVVSAQFVSTVLSNAKKKGGKIGKRGPKPGRKAAMASSIGNVDQLIKAKKLVDQLGGVDAARSAINALAQLLSS
ncbi:hypothetical protein ETAA8_65680 [Anatilimnocola aggregata]|uniref:Uncharacterized protein n=1 Tax=Anatilimnocola aggregata TaxID=2528021 RepID=A0A517YMH4_9BACT|nr:hypothetical protein [Anatilimnocola aggregata]QDU31411.1 hypothetical protein ETAA8_65680 [Anatilimnocola aggregata]